MQPFVDSHAHLADAAFDDDRDAAIARAVAAGAVGIICIGESIAAAERAAELTARYPGTVLFTAGVHPHDADAFDPRRDIEELRRLAAAGAVAIGECGLDYHYDHTPRERQRRTFLEQLVLARELALPVVVHSRDADDDTATMLQEAASAGVRGVLHCFTGSDVLADAALASEWYLSFSGMITFRKWDRHSLVRSVPANRILAESDAPYLAPVPHRGKRNEPAWVAGTIAHMALIRGVSSDEMAETTARNAAALFGVASSRGL